MVNRRIHIIDGLPASSNEFNNYFEWLNTIVNSITASTDKLYVRLPYFDIEKIKIG